MAAQNRLRNHSWPGNVRELRNLVQRLLVLGADGEVTVNEVDEALKQSPTAAAPAASDHPGYFDLPLREAREQFEREYLVYKLKQAGGSVGRLADAVGMERTHLYRKLRTLGVDPKTARQEQKMKIVILGAGQVGSTVAYSLSNEENDITVVDVNPTHLKELQDRLDIRGVLGHASHPTVLVRAGIEDADMVIALTSSDEVNMTACQVAYTLYNTPTRIARIRSSEYIENPRLFEREHCPVDVLISPETLVTQYIARLIEYPGALQVLDFADGRAQLVATQAYAGGPLVGHRLQTLREHMPADADARVAAIYRQDKTIIPDGNTVIEENDTVFFLAAQKNIRMMMRELRPLDNPIRRVILAGGGHIGANLARHLERDHHVKIIERDVGRAEEIAEHLERAIVLVGDCADEELLREEAVDTTDVYCVLTNDDEANILSSMLAKQTGRGKGHRHHQPPSLCGPG